ncbi:MAG: hypothetical protein CMN30_12900 [Sandaracinus sp.]|nr:hypothetical protein [Sandaracinus sp.]
MLRFNLGFCLLFSLVACGDDGRPVSEDGGGGECHATVCANAAPPCFDAAGCSERAECVGAPTPCASIPRVDCGLQMGCAWDEGSATCIGVAAACEGSTTVEQTCVARGCDWEVSCAGETPEGNEEYCQGLQPSVCVAALECTFE